MKVKEFYKSKTFWFGVLIILNAIAGLFGFASYKPGAEVQDIVELIVGIGTVLLRFNSKGAIALRIPVGVK